MAAGSNRPAATGVHIVELEIQGCGLTPSPIHPVTVSEMLNDEQNFTVRALNLEGESERIVYEPRASGSYLLTCRRGSEERTVHLLLGGHVESDSGWVQRE